MAEPVPFDPSRTMPSGQHQTNGWDVANRGVDLVGQQLERRSKEPREPRPRASTVAIVGLVVASLALVVAVGAAGAVVSHDKSEDRGLNATLDALGERMDRFERDQKDQRDLLWRIALANGVKPQ